MTSDSTLDLFAPLAIAFLIGAGAMGIAHGNRWRRLLALCLGGAVYSIYDVAVGRLVEVRELPPLVIVLMVTGTLLVGVAPGPGARRA